MTRWSPRSCVLGASQTPVTAISTMPRSPNLCFLTAPIRSSWPWLGQAFFLSSLAWCSCLVHRPRLSTLSFLNAAHAAVLLPTSSHKAAHRTSFQGLTRRWRIRRRKLGRGRSYELSSPSALSSLIMSSEASVPCPIARFVWTEI